MAGQGCGILQVVVPLLSYSVVVPVPSSVSSATEILPALFDYITAPPSPTDTPATPGAAAAPSVSLRVPRATGNAHWLLDAGTAVSCIAIG
ncbi:hypothetical protein E2C01_030075 [Portunus trituberculatus]|uniref:Secreted protein n=1 Tax=Portunus trituberculatus TaxID=210409 RepID=A0A5B7EPZ7_PORTR|nr:hypothetical protein [Portunus trituberculatus]